MTTKRLRKGAFCTDIHFGKKANSQLHNEDCLRYLDWFCEQVKENNCDYVAFLGDWNENRSALNIATLNYSYVGAKKLNDLGLPVYFCIGNHDLYHRHTRELYSVIPFKEFTNFIIVDHPLVVNNIGNGALFSPYLFHEEYPSLAKHLNLPFWAGHFEFKGFIVTGYGIVMPTGPEPVDFSGPKHIMSGHFHKRQEQGNIVYIGNTFPMDFGDAGDCNRGMAIYHHDKEKIDYLNWKDCPKYLKVKFTDLLDETITIHPHSRIRCVVDVPISFEESTYLRQQFIEDYNLREFMMEESIEMKAVLTETQASIDPDDVNLDSVNDLVIQMLNDIKSDHIDNTILIEQYQRLK